MTGTAQETVAHRISILLKLDGITEIVAKGTFTALLGEGIKRLQDLRVQYFWNSFVEACSKETISGLETNSPDELMAKLLASDRGKDALFEAYRRVCLSASRALGPRIIGFLAAKLVVEDRQATEDEYMYFQAAEKMSDGELSWFKNRFTTNEALALVNRTTLYNKGTDHEFFSLSSVENQHESLPTFIFNIQSTGMVVIQQSGGTVSHNSGTGLHTIPGPKALVYRKIGSFVSLIERAQGPNT